MLAIYHLNSYSMAVSVHAPIIPQPKPVTRKDCVVLAMYYRK